MNIDSQIFKKIKTSKNILVNIHRNADLDSVGAATAMNFFLKQIDKKATIISPQSLSNFFGFLTKDHHIKIIDYKSFDFSPYDLFIILDSGSFEIVTSYKEFVKPKIPIIIIDHHKTNELVSDLKLVIEKSSATCEVLYDLFLKWNVNIDKKIATSLLAGIAGDTVFFKYCDNPKKTYKVISDLVNRGGDKDLILSQAFNSYDINFVKFMGRFLENMIHEKKGRFVWSALPYGEFEKFGKQKASREIVADLFFQSIKNADFGIAMLEVELGKIVVSWRSKPSVDVSVLAKKLGGGGHRQAAGCTVYGNFEEAVQKVLKIAKAQ